MSPDDPMDAVAPERVRRAYAGFARPTWLHRVAAFVILMMLLGVAAALFVWGLLIAAMLALIAAVVWGWRSVRRWMGAEDSLRRGVQIVRRNPD